MIIRQQLWGEQAAAIESALHALDPDLAEPITEVAYETVFARPGLDRKARELLAVTALMSVGGESELKTHLRGALNCGASPGEINEAIIQAAMYSGFAKALATMRVFKSLDL